jgi:RNA-dependent RNA polymerase
MELEGIKMRLRPSMKKFEVPNVESAEIEIVHHFGYPINAYLNRYLLSTSLRRVAPLTSFP